MTDNDTRRKWREDLFERDRTYYEANDEVTDTEPPCTQRVGLRFIPHVEDNKLRLITTVCCEDKNLVLLRNVDDVWGCPDCGLVIPPEVIDILARESGTSITKFRESFNKKESFFKWLWGKLFRNKKVRGLLKP